MSELRRFPRWQVNQQARLRLEQAEEDVLCQVRDINYKGVGVILETKLQQDAAVRLNLRLSYDCAFEAEVWVAWVKVINGINHYGLYFSKLRDTDKEKIYRFVHAHLPKEIVKSWWPSEAGPVGNEGNRGKLENNESQENGGADDHRIFERFPVNVSAHYLNLDTGKEGLANTQDISAKGLCLMTRDELKLDAALEIWLEIKNKGEVLYTRGEVVWVKPVDTNSYKLGIELEKADLMGISRVLKT